MGVPLFQGGPAPAVTADPSTIEASPQSGPLFLVLRRDGAERPCVGLGDLFFPPDGREPTLARKAREAQAVAVCASCPVIGDCFDEALERNERWGIWGGLTERDRRAGETQGCGTPKGKGSGGRQDRCTEAGACDRSRRSQTCRAQQGATQARIAARGGKEARWSRRRLTRCATSPP